MSSLIGYATSAITLIACVARTLATRNALPSLSRRLLTITGIAFAVALTLGAPATLAAAADLEPIANLTRWTGNVAAMMAATCILAMVASIVGTPASAVRSTRHCLLLLAASSTTMLALLTTHTGQSTREFASVYGDDPAITGYMVIYLVYMATSLGRLVCLLQCYARAARADLKRGIEITAAGGLLGLLWVAWKIAGLVATIATDRGIPGQADVSELLASLAIFVGTAGASCQFWEHRVLRWRARRAHAALHLLHTRILDAMPYVRLPADSGGDLTFALYRRIIEIRDAELALRPYLDPEVTAQAAELAKRHRFGLTSQRVLVEAAELAAALDAYYAGCPYRKGPVTSGTPKPTSTSLFSEANWLLRVSAALHTSEHVAQVRRRASAAHTSNAHFTTSYRDTGRTVP